MQKVRNERCQVMNAEETVTKASELNIGEAKLCVDIETADDDAIKNDIAYLRMRL